MMIGNNIGKQNRRLIYAFKIINKTKRMSVIFFSLSPRVYSRTTN